MSIELKPHNEIAYQKIQEKFKSGNKVAVVHPMGTGKSYLALKLIEDRKKFDNNEKSIYIAPSNSILHNIKKEIFESGMTEQDFPNLERITYQKLAKMPEDEIERKYGQAGVIIVDEFHHCGAPEWGRGVQTLLSHCEKAKILGLSVTPIRYSDGLRDMSDEFFDGNVVSEFTLEEAIAEGILPEATYISGVYDFKIEELKENIDGIQDDAEREKVFVDINKYMQNNANVFQKYMNPNGKYIIYCRNIDDMNDKVAKVKEMFGNINSNISAMAISYEQDFKTNERMLQKFENNKDEDTLKLLFSVNMVNEGYRVRDLDGVVMMRPTFSPTVFSQQLGRALSVGNGKNPVIFDLVDNYESCKIIEDFCERMRQYEGRPRGDKGGETSKISRIKLVDYSKDFKEIVDRIMEISNEAEEYKSLIKYRTPSSDVIVKLGKQLTSGNKKARKKLIESYLEFSKGVASEFKDKYSSLLSIDIEELQQMASMGVVYAVDDFNPNDYKNVDRKMVSKMFRHYMADTIRSSIMEEIKKSDINAYNDIMQGYKEKEKLSYEALVENEKENLINSLPDDKRAVEVNGDIIADGVYQYRTGETEKFDKLSESGLDQVEKLIDAKVTREELEKDLDKALLTLTRRETRVIKRRAGLGEANSQGVTLDKIGQDMNVSKERIRQIEAKGLRKLRHPARRKKLNSYFSHNFNALDNYSDFSDDIEYIDSIARNDIEKKKSKSNGEEKKITLNSPISELNLDDGVIFSNGVDTIGDLVGKYEIEINHIVESGDAYQVIKRIHDMGYMTADDLETVNEAYEGIHKQPDMRELSMITISGKFKRPYHYEKSVLYRKYGIETFGDALNMLAYDLKHKNKAYGTVRQ